MSWEKRDEMNELYVQYLRCLHIQYSAFLAEGKFAGMPSRNAKKMAFDAR